jgi:hypothetical protein
VQSPGDRHKGRAEDALRSESGLSQLVKDVGIVDGVSAGNEGEDGKRAEHCGRDLGTNTKNRRWGSSSFPVARTWIQELYI